MQIQLVLYIFYQYIQLFVLLFSLWRICADVSEQCCLAIAILADGNVKNAQTMVDEGDYSP